MTHMSAITKPYRFRRLGNRRPAVYAVETPADYLGNVEAVHASWSGASRSSNTYRAFPVTRRGYARSSALLDAELLAGSVPHETHCAGDAVFASRRAAADALVEYLKAAAL